MAQLSMGTSSWADFPASGTGAPVQRKQFFILAAVWLVGTALLFLFRPGYFFPPTDNIDSWVYTGYQWDLRRHIREFGALYYGARLSWILPGAFLHSLLPPIAANICLKLVVSALLAIAGSTIVYRTLGFRAALVAVSLAVWAPQFIYALHTDYDIAVITYASLAVAGITAAKDSRFWPAWILFSGVMFTCMVVANLTSLGMPGLGIAVFHLLWLRWDIRRQLGCLGLYAIAAVGTLSALGLASCFVGGEFLFMKPQFAMLRYLKGDQKNPWEPKDWRWLLEATWLIVPCCAIVWGFFRSFFAPSPNQRVDRLIGALTWGLVVALGVGAVLELHGNPVLSLYYYSSFLLCLAIPLLVACYASAPRHAPASFTTLVGSGLIVALLVLGLDPVAVGQRLVHFLPVKAISSALPVTAAVVLLIVSTVALFSVARPQRFPRLLPSAEICLIGIIAASIPVPFHSTDLFFRPRERYASVHAAFDEIREKFAPDSYRFWEHPRQRGSRSLTSTWLWGYRLFTTKPFPQFEPDRLGKLGDRTLIVTAPANSGNETLAQARNAFAGFAEIKHAEINRIPGDAGTGFDLVALSFGGHTAEPASDIADFDRSNALLTLDSRSGAGYVRALEKNLYGPVNGAKSALVSSDGTTWFKRTDPRDHLATPFFKLGAPPTGQSLVISVEMPASGQTLLVVQDETFHVLKQILLVDAGKHAYGVALPANSQSIRLYFTSPIDDPVPLPTQVVVKFVPAGPKSGSAP